MLSFVGYGLTTADILYHRPDHLWLLQRYLWQAFDQAPSFPRLHRFLDFWQSNLDGPLHSVTITHATLVMPAELRYASNHFLM